MKYTKENVIEIARARGSRAQTIPAAIRYLKSHPLQFSFTRKGLPRGLDVDHWIRGLQDKIDYQESKLHTRAMEFCRCLKLKTREEAIQIAKKRDKTRLKRIEGFLKSHYPYRTSKSQWAGGDHHISVYFGTPACQGWATKEWSRNGKWRGTNSHARFDITRRVLRHFPQAVTPDGLVVMDAKKIGPREYQIVWAEQSRGFDLKTIEGFLIKGFHVKNIDLEKARRKAAQERTKTLTVRLQEREQKQNYRKELRNLTHIWVGFDDSIQAGNCKTATENFNRQVNEILGGGKVGGLRADYLISIRDDVYVRRAIAAASRRY